MYYWNTAGQRYELPERPLEPRERTVPQSEFDWFLGPDPECDWEPDPEWED